MNPRRVLSLTGFLILIGIGGWFFISHTIRSSEEARAKEALQAQIQSVIDTRRAAQQGGEETDPFDENGIFRLLFIGLDSRSGSTIGHCDAIQFIEINKTNQTVTITAVPRGTHAPLPGSGHLPSDYYVSSACAIGGLDYGIAQIENILGQQADYVAMVGFSEALGTFRLLGLPTTETLQWLRLRQGYAIGEPQRAHNHSTFLKQLLVDHPLTGSTPLEIAGEYLLYQLVETDLSFSQVRQIVAELSAMDLPNHAERISLLMKPSYAVTDIPYDTEHLDDYLSSMLDPITNLIPEGAYTGVSEFEAQQQLIDLVNAGLEDTDFVTRAFEQKLWLQIEDEAIRESVHFALLSTYFSTQPENEEQKNILLDYVIVMEASGQTDWAERGRALLEEKFGSSCLEETSSDTIL